MPTLAIKQRESKDAPTTSAVPAIAEVKLLADKLIQQARLLPASPDFCEAGDSEDEVVLDMEIEGMRCLILRTKPKQTAVSISLSPREQEIARMIAKGYPNKMIAAVLDISAWTVCTHIRRVFAKLGVGSRAEMVAKLLETGSLHGSLAKGPHHSFKEPD